MEEAVEQGEGRNPIFHDPPRYISVPLNADFMQCQQGEDEEQRHQRRLRSTPIASEQGASRASRAAEAAGAGGPLANLRMARFAGGLLSGSGGGHFGPGLTPERA